MATLPYLNLYVDLYGYMLMGACIFCYSSMVGPYFTDKVAAVS